MWTPHKGAHEAMEFTGDPTPSFIGTTMFRGKNDGIRYTMKGLIEKWVSPTTFVDDSLHSNNVISGLPKSTRYIYFLAERKLDNKI